MNKVLKKVNKDLIKKYVDKLDAKIMYWFYDLIELLFDTTLIHDSTELRTMLRKGLTKAIKARDEEWRERIKGLKKECIKYKAINKALDSLLKPQQRRV